MTAVHNGQQMYGFRCCSLDFETKERLENHILVVHGKTWLAGRIRRERAKKTGTTGKQTSNE